MSIVVEFVVTNGVIGPIREYTIAERKNAKGFILPPFIGFTGIADYAFSYFRNMYTIQVPDTVTRIGAFAFAYNDVKYVYNFGDIEYIGDNAFEGCTSLASISFNIKNTGTPILGNEIFRGCTKLTDVRITNLSKLKKFGTNIFRQTPYEPYWNSCIPLLIANGIGLKAPYIWTQKTFTNNPMVRYLLSMAFDSNRNKIVLFGGGNGGTYLNDTWEYDGITWTPRNLGLTVPPIRILASMAFDSHRNVIVLFGGKDTESLNDTWEYNGTTWTEVTVTGSKPSPRNAACMVFDSNRNKMVLFGGLYTTYLNDIWEYDGETSTWTEVSITGSKPIERSFAYMAFDSSRNKILLFGGSVNGVGFDDFWEYNWNTSTWTEDTITVSKPSPRYGGSMVFDSNRNKMVVFGGRTTINLNETWEYGAL